MGFGNEPPTPQKPSDLPRAPRVPIPSAPGPLKTQLQVLSMFFRTAAPTPSMLPVSMT